MILVITSAPKVRDSLAALEKETGERVQIAPTLTAAIHLLREQQFTAVVFDDFLLDADLQEAEVALDVAGSAIPVFINFAISGPERLVRDVRVALRRRERELVIAHEEAESWFRGQLNEALTGILLSSELALRVPALPHAAEAKMRSIYQLAMDMRARLEPTH